MTEIERRVRALPLWKGPLKLDVLKGGISNLSYKATDSTGCYVARVGADFPFHHVSRAREAMTSRAAFAAGLAPELIYDEPGFMVFRFVEAKTYDDADVRANIAPIVRVVQRCHADLGKRITGEARFFWVFQIIRDYAAQLEAAKHRLAQSLPGWLEVTEELEQAQVPVPVVFGHHDLLAGNFMDDGKRLWLIDWEYGAFSSPLFDLANLASNNSFAEAEEAQLLEAYFNESPGVALWRAFYAMKTASTLREAMWAMVSELHLTNTGVDYVGYAAEFLGRYERDLAGYRARFGAT